MDWSPPPKFDLARPAILRVAEPWERQVNRDLIAKGFPLSVRQDVIRALRRVVGAKPSIIRATERDLGLYLGLGGSFASLVASNGGGSEGFGISYIGSHVDTSDGASYNLGTVALGDTHASRWTLIGLAWRDVAGNNKTSTLTLGGSSATIVDRATNNGTIAELYRIDSSALGATANLSVSLSAAIDNIRAYVFRAILPSGGTPHDSANASGGTSATVSGFDVPAGGFAVAIGVTNGGGVGSESFSRAAHEIYPSTQTGLAISFAQSSFTWSNITPSAAVDLIESMGGATNRTCIACGSWAP